MSNIGTGRKHLHHRDYQLIYEAIYTWFIYVKIKENLPLSGPLSQNKGKEF